MRRESLLGLAVLAGAALACTGCAPAASADLSVTFTDGSDEVVHEISLTDLSCKTSSVARIIVSDSVTGDGEEVFLANAPTDGRDAYAISLWVDGFRFVSTEKFDASGSRIDFDKMAGFITESPDGHQAAGEETQATLNGTVACG